MYAKLKIILFVIIIIIITVIIRYTYLQQETKEVMKQNDEVIAETTIETKENKVEIETDKEGKTEESIKVTELVETEKNIETNKVETIEPIKITETKIVDEPEQPIEVESLFCLSDYERNVAECIVMGEAGNQSYEGQILVAQCLFNACLKEGLKPSEIKTEYRYSGWHENPSDSVKNAVSAVFDDGYKMTEEFILYFYAPKYSKSKWHESQRFVIEEGGHRFFAGWDD